MLVSDCCGSPAFSNGDSDTGDIGICPDCGEHCEYIDDEELSEEEKRDMSNPQERIKRGYHLAYDVKGAFWVQNDDE